jgi:hypothetical protein
MVRICDKRYGEFVIIEHFIELTALVQGIQSSCKQKFGSQGRLALLPAKAIEMA